MPAVSADGVEYTDSKAKAKAFVKGFPAVVENDNDGRKATFPNQRVGEYYGKSISSRRWGVDRKRFDDYAMALHAIDRNRMIQERSVVVDPETGEVLDPGLEAGSGVSTSRFPTLYSLQALPSFKKKPRP